MKYFKRKNPKTGTVHIVWRRDIMYCGVQDKLSKFGSPRGFDFPTTNCTPTCKTCIKAFAAAITKYFLKAPWQSERKEVTKEQFIKAKLDFMATSCHLQSPSFAATPFKSKHGIEGWVEK